MWILNKSIKKSCPYCGVIIKGTTPRYGQHSAQTKCRTCNNVLGVVSNSGNVEVFVR